MVEQKTIDRLVEFVHNLEEKLSSIQTIQEKLQELMFIVSKTNDSVVEELSNLKIVLNDITIDQHTNEMKNDQRMNNNDQDLKRSDYSSRMKFSKSVSFTLDKNPFHQRLAKQINNETVEEIIVPINSSSSENTSILRKIFPHIRIEEIESNNGDYLRLLNLSNCDSYDLSGHFLQQNTLSKFSLSRFRFPSKTIIQPGQTITIYCANAKDITPRSPDVFLWKEQQRWETGSECLTSLLKPNGQSIAWSRISVPVPTDQSSNDIPLVQSKSNVGVSDALNSSSNLFKTSSRLSARSNRLPSFHTFGNNTKSRFVHSSNNPMRSDSNGTIVQTPNDLRSQLNQRVGLSEIRTRWKSSSVTGRHTSNEQAIDNRDSSRTEQ